MQCGLSLKHVGQFVRLSRLKVFVKFCRFLSSEVILKSPNNVIFSWLSRYCEIFFDMLSKNKELFSIGGLYKPTMSHFLQRVLTSRNIA